MLRLPDGLTTPALVVDVDTLDRNLDRMAVAARENGFALRPHVKTHKSPRLAERQLRAGARGLTVATVSEAEVFAASGADDLFIAYPLWTDEAKGTRLSILAERVRLSVGVDSVAGARQLGRFAPSMRVLVEVDSGHHRTGVTPANAATVALAAVSAGLDVMGVFTFPGHGYDPLSRERAARDEERALATAAAALRDAGLDVPVVSGGSTPTVAATRPGTVTEVRPGVYVFNDAQQLTLGSCTPEEIALVAAATVVSAPAPDRIVLDAGSKVLGADRPSWTPGYGVLPELPGAVVSSLSEHHAVVSLAPGTVAPRLGSVVAVVPNHVCSAVNLADELVIARDGAVVDRWPVTARGANT